MPAQAQAIQIRDLWKSYDHSPHPALRGISLDVAPGEFLAVVGGSGSGKTTLLKSINRLIEPTRGTVAVDGADVRSVDPVQLRRRIGYVFQGVGLFPHLTVADNIGVTLRLLGWSREAIAERVAELLDLVRLPREIATRYPATLSGGQGQRTGLARALAAKPKMMLMDEPFAAVDPIVRDALSSDYRALHERLGLTTVMVTHDVLEAVLLADRIAVMEDGLLAASGTPTVMLTHPATESVRALMEMPRRRAERVRALTSGGAG